MSGPLVTVRHVEHAAELAVLCSPTSERIGMDVSAEIVYAPGQTQDALAAVERLAESLRRQIADAAERSAR